MTIQYLEKRIDELEKKVNEVELLEKIRAEIEQIRGNEYEVSDMQGNIYRLETIEKSEALQIIDKYRTEDKGGTK